MRILYHHRTLADGAEGVHIAAMVDAFRALGHEVTVLGLAGPEGSAPSTSKLGRLRDALPSWGVEVAALGANAAEYSAVARQVQRARPDLIYKRHARFDVATVAAARRHHVPVVLEVNCLFTQPPYVDFEPLALRRTAVRCERYALRHSSLVLSVSSPLGRMIQSLSGVTPLVVPNGVDTDRFDLDKADPGPVRQRFGLGSAFVMGWVGVLREWHGLDLLVEALADLPSVHLLIVGDGPGRENLERVARNAGVADRVNVTGRVRHEEMPHFIAAMDVAVVADERTRVASPMKLLEYMAMGRAVVAPDLENIRDVVTDRATGLLFKAGDRTSLHQCLRTVCTDRDFAERLGANARRTIREHRSWVAVASTVLQSVDTAMRSRGNAGGR